MTSCATLVPWNSSVVHSLNGFGAQNTKPSSGKGFRRGEGGQARPLVIRSVLLESDVSSRVVHLPFRPDFTSTREEAQISERESSQDDLRDQSFASSSEATTEVGRYKKLARGRARTTRRRAIAMCLALASFSKQPSEQQTAMKHTGNLRDLIKISEKAPAVTTSTQNFGDYSELVTVSTGSNGSSQLSGATKEVPTYIRGDYQLCMGDGFHVQLPSGWRLQDSNGYFGPVLRYEDCTDPSTNVTVLKSPTSQARTESLGDPEEWITAQADLLSAGYQGKQASNASSAGERVMAKVLTSDRSRKKQGLTYYTYEILTKQGEDAEPLHELVSAVVNDGNLYLCRVQSGEERWNVKTKDVAQKIVDSFQITGFKVHL